MRRRGGGEWGLRAQFRDIRISPKRVFRAFSGREIPPRGLTPPIITPHRAAWVRGAWEGLQRGLLGRGQAHSKAFLGLGLGRGIIYLKNSLLVKKGEGTVKGTPFVTPLPIFYEQAIFKINYSPPPPPNPSPKKALEWACPLPRSPLWGPSQAPLTQAARWGGGNYRGC